MVVLKPVTVCPSLPTPVRLCADLSTPHAELWLKDDGAIHATYGGNKVRKLVRILAQARERGAKRVLTVGAAGSHHVLTTALFAPAYGLRVAAVLGPQPRTAHAEGVFLATLARGVEVTVVPSFNLAPLAVARSFRRGDHWIPPGGSDLLGAAAYAAAAQELALQIAAGELPEPDVIVVALGSGGTAAGLAAGALQHGLRARIAAVQVVPGMLPRRSAFSLARRLAPDTSDSAALTARLHIVRDALGAGYGVPTEAGARAERLARGAGIVTEPTYTAKALAHALALVRDARGPPPLRVLYWHTLSRAPAPPAEDGGESLNFEQLDAKLQRLLTPL